MSVIAWDGFTVASDRRQEIFGRVRAANKTRKIDTQEGKDSVVALLGDAAIAEEIVWWLSESRRKSEDFPSSARNGDGLVVLIPAESGDIVVWGPSPVPAVFSRDAPYAWGAGSDLAIGAMEAGADAQRAVEIANKHCSTCGLGVDVISLDP